MKTRMWCVSAKPKFLKACTKASEHEVIRMDGHKFPVDGGTDERCTPTEMMKYIPSKNFGTKSYDKKHISVDNSSDEDSGNNLT